MKYRIPETVIEDFNASLDEVINYHEKLKISYPDKELLLKHCNWAIDYLEELKQTLRDKKAKKFSFSFFFVISSLIRLDNPSSNAVLLKIIGDTAKFHCPESETSGVLRPLYRKNLVYLEKISSLLDGNRVKKGQEIEFIKLYSKYVGVAGASLVATMDFAGLDKSNMNSIKKKMATNNFHNFKPLWDFLGNYDVKYRKLFEVQEESKKTLQTPENIKVNNSKAYTIRNEVHEYIKGMEVQKLCSPRYLNSLLILEGYPEEGRKNLLRCMIGKLIGAPEVLDALVGEYLTSFDSELSKKWDYIVIQKTENKKIDASYIYGLFFTIPGIDLVNNMGSGYIGIGYEEQDIRDFITAGVEELYTTVNREEEASKLTLTPKSSKKA